MGVGLAIAAVTIGATVATALFARGPRSMKGADMAPANLDAFRLTTAEEGTVIPRVFGTVRLPGNLLYYGNLSSEPEYEETAVGGKGGKKKKQKVLQGYHYRMDVWQGIGMGPLELVGVYQDDRLLTEQGGAIPCAEQVWNDGTGAFYPAQAGPYASRLPGVAHVWLRQFYLGFNVSMMPTLHYVVRFCGDIPLEHAILSNGVNPAAIILQLLLDAGASWPSIDKPSFSAAASFWAQKGYGLNIVFSRQKPVREHIMQVLGFVGGWLVERADGTLSLRAPDPDAAPSAVLGEGDFLEGSFSFKRAAWDTTWNDLSGKFTDAAQDYSERAVTANNAASIQLLGLRRKKSVDLTAFTDRSAAQRRIEELRDVESYPAASFSFDVPRDYAHIEQGQILEITHPRFGLSGVRVRVLEVAGTCPKTVSRFRPSRLWNGCPGHSCLRGNPCPIRWPSRPPYTRRSPASRRGRPRISRRSPCGIRGFSSCRGTRKRAPNPRFSCWRRGSCFPRKGCSWSVPPRTPTTAPLGCFRLRGRSTGRLPRRTRRIRSPWTTRGGCCTGPIRKIRPSARSAGRNCSGRGVWRSSMMS